MVNIIQRYAIGIDIESTSVKFGIVDYRGITLHKGIELKLQHYQNLENLIDDIHYRLNPLVQVVGKNYFRGIGVSFYKLYPDDYVEIINNKKTSVLEWSVLSELVSKKFDLPCTVANEVNASAIGEMTFGVAKGMRDFTIVTLGERVSSATVCDGRILSGSDGISADVGQIIVKRGFRRWHNGLNGCLDAFASNKGMIMTARHLLKRSTKPSILRTFSFEDLTVDNIQLCAQKGDKLAQDIYQMTGSFIGQALANLVILALQNTIILAGKLVLIDDFMLHTVRTNMIENLPLYLRNNINFFITGLTETNASIVSASSLVWDKLEKKHTQKFEEMCFIHL